jgi:general nucleoside transport system permease protein
VNDTLVVQVLTEAVVYGTPILFAALGELLAERSGVLNLGVEGMMLVGAAMGFWGMQRAPGPMAVALTLAVLTAAFAALVMALIFGMLVVSLRASQIVAGLALTIFAGGLGLSSYLGNDLGIADLPPKYQFGDIDVFGLKDLPVVGPILFHQSALVYLSWGLTAAIAFYLSRTRFGLNVRAVGESPGAADAMGINVARYSLAITPGWTSGDSLVGGAGWIAIALVIFSFWRPELCLVGAYFFGGLSGGLPSALQARGYGIAPEFLNALPYVMTIVVLVLVSAGFARRRIGAPAALGVPYVREER